MKSFLCRAVLCVTFLALVFASVRQRAVAAQTNGGPIRIGWIGAMTGPTAKYGSYQAATLAMEDINNAGGVNGRPLELIFQDGRGNSRDAITAANYLINREKVHYIVGGHCTPETLPVAAIAEKNKVIMVAAVTSSPKVTSAGDYIFRVTAVNTTGVDILLPYAATKLPAKRYAVLSEETDYALGLGEYFRDKAPAYGLSVVASDSYSPGETDFRTLLARIKQSGADGIYLSVQAPDSAVLIRQQMEDLRLKMVILGNELTGNAVKADSKAARLFEGVVFHEPGFNREAPLTKSFIERFKSRFSAPDLPYGFWTAESYDAVRVLADTIAKCGDDVEAVKNCLYRVKDFGGVSAPIGFDGAGDGIRQYTLKTVEEGELTELKFPAK